MSSYTYLCPFKHLKIYFNVSTEFNHNFILICLLKQLGSIILNWAARVNLEFVFSITNLSQ